MRLITNKTFLMLFVVFGLFIASTQAQYYNKEVKAEILVARTSEYYEFKAAAENLTPSDYNLSYDLMLFKKDNQGNTSKSNQANRFFLQAREKIILSEVVVNYSAEGEYTIVLVIYDQNGKPIGQDRLELKEGGKTHLDDRNKENKTSAGDQAKPQDGFILGGFVIENTITKAGRDFYRYYYSDYFNRGIKTAVNINIDEVPGRGRTTLISVKVADKLVWQFFSQPRKEFLKKMARTAMQRTIGQLQRLQQQSQELTRY